MMSVKKLAVLFCLLGTVLVLSAQALPAGFTAKGNPGLYRKLMPLAKENLKKLDSSHKKAYKKMLREQDDILMAYLLAYESDGNLQQAEPQDVLSNYLQIRSLLNTRGTTHEPEFFLAYVADQTVSDERIEAYREALLRDGLRDIMDKSPNEMELYRAVSQWCVGRLKFQPTSGRDQSPLDITRKSLLGRCEEMQILFVAAARTVGLPSRAASTPWWPHTDNNHAWAEVWLEGAWHYTGDMDAAYYPDQTWFSGMIDKTVLIIADGTLPAPGDEVLAQGRYECSINSIRNYAGERTRSIHIQTVDEQGLPLPETALGVLVYNWGSLRALAWVKTDKEGELTLSAGRGAFYLSASKDGKQALELVPSTEDIAYECVITLKEGALAEQDAMLNYPANPFAWKQAPEVWNAGVKVAQERWSKVDRQWRERASDYPDSLLAEFAALFRGNQGEFERFLQQTHWLDGEFMAYCVGNEEEGQYIDPKFFWQASAEQVEALALQFMAFEHEFYYQDLASVIQPSVFYEELSEEFSLAKDVLTLFPKSFYFKHEDRMERLNLAMKWLKKKYKVDAAKALKGLLPLHVAIEQKYLSPTQYRLMAVSLARANRVPAEFSYQPDLIYVQHQNGEWGYYDIMKCAPETKTGETASLTKVTVALADEIGVPVAGMAGGLALTRFIDGSFYWLDQDFKEEGNGVYSVQVPKGEYYLQAGYRVSDSRTAFQMKRLDNTEADSSRVELSLREFPRKWEPAGKELLDILAEADTLGFSVAVIGNQPHENTKRICYKLEDLGVDYILIGALDSWSETPPARENYRFSPLWKTMHQADNRNWVRVVTLVRKDGEWQSYEGLWERMPD